MISLDITPLIEETITSVGAVHPKNLTGKKRPKVRWEWSDTMTRCLGKAYYSKGLIRLSIPLWKRASAEERRNVVIHEVCHLLADRVWGRKNIKPHGFRWASLMTICDEKANRCHKVDRTGLRRKSRKFKATCPCRNQHLIGPIRARRIKTGVTTYTCTKCKGPITLI